MESKALLEEVLKVVEAASSSAFDHRLCRMLAGGQVTGDRVETVGRFLLGRHPDAPSVCVSLLDARRPSTKDVPTVRLAIALLDLAPHESWDKVLPLLKKRQDVVRDVLREVAEKRAAISPIRVRLSRTNPSPHQAGELIALLLRVFPPSADAFSGDLSSDDGLASDLRSSLINWLADTADLRSIEALQQLDRRLGKKYPAVPAPCSRRTCVPHVALGFQSPRSCRGAAHSQRQAIDGVRRGCR